MRNAVGFILILSLAACSRQEPPATTPSETVAGVADPGASSAAAAPAANGGAGLPRDDGGHRPPLQGAPPTTNPSATVPAPDGEAIFAATCATCHMADGNGVPYLQPSIMGSAWISNPDPQPLLSLILRGSAILGEAAQAYNNDMAPQDHLSDAEIAAVASHVRSRFAPVPITGPVTPAQVAIARKRPGLPQ